MGSELKLKLNLKTVYDKKEKFEEEIEKSNDFKSSRGHF